MEKPTLGQISTLAQILQENENVNIHFETDNAFELLTEGGLTNAQKGFMYNLIFSKSYRGTPNRKGLYDLLEQFKFTRKLT